MAKIIGIILIVGSFIIGFLGVQKIQDSSASVEILDAEIGITDESGKNQGYIFLGIGAVLLIGGIYSVSRKS